LAWAKAASSPAVDSLSQSANCWPLSGSSQQNQCGELPSNGLAALGAGRAATKMLQRRRQRPPRPQKRSCEPRRRSEPRRPKSDETQLQVATRSPSGPDLIAD
jgi:hypothetical protein